VKKISIFVFVLLVYAQAAAAFTIATGSKEGTYYKIAQDIKRVAKKEGLDLKVITSNGSFENIKLLGQGKADLAIVQKDALGYFADFIKETDKSDVFDQVKIVLNLYPEEVHVITNNKDLASFRDLQNKRVAVGSRNSGTLLTSDYLFQAYKLKAKTYDFGPTRAVDELRKGNIDAMIFVGGAPVAAFKTLDKEFRYVRLPQDDRLDKIYQRKILERDFYKWAKTDTATYAINSVIVARNRNNQDYIVNLQRLVLAILKNKESLESNGHPKWKKSLIRYFYRDVGFGPTNDIIKIYNLLTEYGYKIVKK